METSLKVNDLVYPDLQDAKFAPILLGVSTITANKPYFLLRDQDIESHIITGIETYSNSATQWMPAVLNLNGQNYNVIQFADLKNCLFNLRDKTGKYLLRNCPFSTFVKYPFECAYFELDLDLGQSYVKFTQSPLITPMPMVIPMFYFFNREKIFK